MLSPQEVKRLMEMMKSENSTDRDLAVELVKHNITTLKQKDLVWFIGSSNDILFAVNGSALWDEWCDKYFTFMDKTASTDYWNYDPTKDLTNGQTTEGEINSDVQV